MAVIINEFEVVPQPEPAAPAKTSPAAAHYGPKPEAIELALMRMAQRVSRLRAH